MTSPTADHSAAAGPDDEVNSTSNSINNSTSNSISTFAYFNSNASVISYDSILTNERILDRLDLSPDDEVLLQQVLKEEKLQQLDGPTQRDSRVLCVPASQFPSLKVRQVQEPAHSNNSTESIRQLLEKDFTFRDKSLAAQVEQHYASTSRYSYIVEEDGEDEYPEGQEAVVVQPTQTARGIANTNNIAVPSHKQQGVGHQDGRHANGNVPSRYHHSQNASYSAARMQHTSIPNFERYRVDNSRWSTHSKKSANHSLSNSIGAPSHHNRNYHQLGNTFGPTQYGFPRDKTAHATPSHNTPRESTPEAVATSRPTFAMRSSYKFNSQTPESSLQSQSEPPSVSTSRTRTPMMSTVNDRSTENVNAVTTPKKGTRDIDDPNFGLEPIEKPQSHKTHKKKSSLTSFKNLFKTPKSKKTHSKEELVSKTKSNSETSNHTKEFSAKESSSSLDLTSSNSSVENSPSLGKSNLRKFIFPPNPNLHFDSKTSHNKSNNIMYKDNHYRSLSDMNKPNSISHATGSMSLQTSPSHVKTHKHSVSTQSGEAVLYLDNNRIIDLANNNVSTGLSDVSSHDTVLSEEERVVKSSSPISLSMSLKENILMTPHLDNNITTPKTDAAPVETNDDITPQTTVTKPETFSSNPLITSAINMRIEGKLEASAAKLRRACQAGDQTAFLLYGLALRHGCGVPEDQTMSLTFIMKATGIESFQDEVFNCNINPLELEENNSIPTKLEEPLVPALHECGISYLKGYGVPEVDEFRGLKFLEKAASLNHVDSMCLCGIIWSQKSPDRKKDISRAAAWFRLADKRGANLIGSEWIYKKKYMKGEVKNN